MPTFLELLEEHDLRIEREAAARHQQAQMVQLFEDAWASEDPLTGNVLPTGLGSARNDLLQYQALGRHSARPGSRRYGANPPFFWTEQQHWLIVDAARVVEAMCPTAQCILDVLCQFCIFNGFEYTVVPRKKAGEEPSEGNDAIVNAAQDLLDKWMQDNDWYQWELELFRRSRRDGEAFVIFDEGEDGEPVRLRSVEPEQVKEPQDARAMASRVGADGSYSWKFGILTPKDDTSKPEAYYVVSQYSDAQLRGEVYTADEVCHIKTESVDRQTKRGISDFFCVANDLPGVKKLLRNLREGATVQAAIAWVREHPEGAMPAAMGSTGTHTTRTGQTMGSVHYDGPTMIDVSAGMKYTAGPLAGTGQSETLIQVLQAALRNIGARWQMPEGIVSGDASNANLASALVAEGPFTRALQTRQWFYRSQYKRLIERVLEKAAIDGLLSEGENLLDKIEVSVEMPPVIARKEKEETERNAILSERGILGNRTWSARENLDRDAEQADMEADPIEPLSMELTGGYGEAEDSTSSENASSQDGEQERVS